MSELSGRERAMASVRKAMPDAFVLEDKQDYGVLTTGSIAADFVTVCGGFPRARVTEISGFEASGKTTLVLAAIARAQAAGLHVTYLDPEQALDPTYARRLGVDLDDPAKGLFIQPSTFEETARAAEAFITEDATDILAIDSVSAMLPECTMEGDIGNLEAIGLRARHMSAWVPRLIQSTRRSVRKPAVLLVNQLRMVVPKTPFEARFGAKTTTTGGMALRFYASMRVEMKQVRRGVIKREADDPFRPGKEVEIPVASEHEVKTTKNKVGEAYRDAPVWIRYDEKLDIYGIDNVQTLLSMAHAKGVIEANRAGFYKIGEKSVRGEAGAHEYLAKSPEVCAGLAAELGLNWANYAPPGTYGKA